MRNFLRRIKEWFANFIWWFRNKYNLLKEKVANGYESFTETKVGGPIHKYFLRYIGIIVRSNTFRGLLYLSPALVLLIIFSIYPIFNSILIAFYENYVPVGENAGIDGYTLENFKVIIGQPGFIDAIKNTAVIVFVSVPLSVIISLFIAVMLNSIKPLKSFFQTVFFLPYVTNTIAIGLVFSYMFHYDYGLINRVLDLIGLSPVAWKNGDATYLTAMTTLLIYTIWGSLAFKILVFTAGLQNIDKQYYDAAKVDATPKWRVFRRITVPLLSPMIAYVSITSLIGGFKTYTTVVALYGESGRTHGGVDLRTIVFYVYEYIQGGNTLDEGELSRGAAASLILFGIILVFTLIQLYISKKRVHY